MISKVSSVIRSLIVIALTLILAFVCIVRLARMQLVDGSYYAAQLQQSYTATQSVQAARGQIADSNGVVLSGNQIVYKMIIQKAFFTAGMENLVISRAIQILIEEGEAWIDTIPISSTVPYEFTTDKETVLDAFKERIGVNYDATVDNCIKALYEKYKITTEFPEQMRRYIAGVRYEMELKDFSYSNRYTFAENISIQTVARIKELAFLLPGIDIVEEPMRTYIKSSTAPHVLGTLGAITAEVYELKKDQGYTLNDTIGLNGIELAMEDVLRGKNGIRTIVRNADGVAISDEITQPVVTGNSVQLTIDAKFQDDLQDILENHINWLHYNNDPKRGNTCDAGAVVVLDVKTGAVLGMANYPTYDINAYLENPQAFLELEGNPLYNRAIYGRYRPGSTFKTITGAAGLYHGYIDKHSQGICTGKYTYYSDYQPLCTGSHYGYNVVDSLKVSCNIFFYDLGRRMGIYTLSDFAERFGIGTNLGLEIGGISGRMTTPEVFESLVGTEWTSGNTLQASIGQSETLVTPLHLAVQAMTLANDGVRYKPYLVKSIYNYDFTELLHETEPVVVETIDPGVNPNTFNIIREGMVAVSENVVWPVYDMSKSQFKYLPYHVAIKTGTAETSEPGVYNSIIMGYYPAEDPVIAFGVVLEKGEYSRYMIRNIIDAYFYDAYEPDMDEEGNIISPWKTWDSEKTPVR